MGREEIQQSCAEERQDPFKTPLKNGPLRPRCIHGPSSWCTCANMCRIMNMTVLCLSVCLSLPLPSSLALPTNNSHDRHLCRKAKYDIKLHVHTCIHVPVHPMAHACQNKTFRDFSQQTEDQTILAMAEVALQNPALDFHPMDSKWRYRVHLPPRGNY